MGMTKYLDRQDGRIAYQEHGGDGPLVIAAPGMGDMMGVYRHVVPLMTGAGLRFVTMDLRGLGESTTGFSEYTDESVASDYLALIDHIGAGPAVLVGNSLSCASAVIAATDRPTDVSAIALLGPFVRKHDMKWWQELAFAGMLAPPWGKSAWVSYYRKNLYPGAKPADLAEYAASLSANLGESGRMPAFRALAGNDHAESGRRISQVTQPVLVVMGTADPDFPDAAQEAKELGEIMDATVQLVDGAGHYPQADSPDQVAPAIIELVNSANAT